VVTDDFLEGWIVRTKDDRSKKKGFRDSIDSDWNLRSANLPSFVSLPLDDIENELGYRFRAFSVAWMFGFLDT
jgi:hypothetical protein